MRFDPYKRASSDGDYRFLGARVLIAHVVERSDLIQAVQEHLELERPEGEPSSRAEVERLTRARLTQYGEFMYEGDDVDCFERAEAIVDRLFPELIEYERTNNHNTKESS